MLKEKNNKKLLDANWTDNCNNAGNFYISTLLEISHSNITFDIKKSNPTSNNKLQLAEKKFKEQKI